VPAEFVVVAELPLNASGKILKRELRVRDTIPAVVAS
jgi:acyl-coenzyme A synthetase/AMP-(fatty) acid ligase